MCEAGDLILIPFPFSDLSTAKRRPALLLTDPDPNGDFVACAITSRGGRPHSRALTPDLRTEGTLPLASWIRTDKVFSFHIGLLVRQFGRVTEACRLGVIDDLCRYLRHQDRA